MFDSYLPAAYLPSNGASAVVHVPAPAAAAAAGSAAAGSLAAAAAASSTGNITRAISARLAQPVARGTHSNCYFAGDGIVRRDMSYFILFIGYKVAKARIRT